jgi:hypothetical protein
MHISLIAEENWHLNIKEVDDMHNLAFQSSCGFAIPLSQLSPKSHRAFDKILSCALITEAEGVGHNAVRSFAFHSRNEIAELRRQGISVSETALIEEVARWLFSDMLSRRRETTPNRLLANCLLDELDWRYPSRYAAAKALRRVAQEKGAAGSLSESDLSKLDNSGHGVSAERISEAIFLLNSNIEIRPNLGAARLFVLQPLITPDSSSNESNSASSSWTLHYPILRKTMYDMLICDVERGNEPYIVMAPFNAGQMPKRLVPIHPWSDNEEAWKKSITMNRDRLAALQGVSIDGIEITPTESREALSWDARSIPKDTAILVSIFDVGSPLLATSLCLQYDIAPVKNCSIDDRAVEPNLTNRLLCTLGKLRDVFGILDLFQAHADVATILATNPPQNPSVPGPLPRPLALGGVQSVYLLIHIVDRLCCWLETNTLSETENRKREPPSH